MEAKRNNTNEELHVVMFPWFAFGHINPYISLSNKLSSKGIQISFLSIPGNIPQIETSLNLSTLSRVIPLTIPPIEGLPPEFNSTIHMTPRNGELLKVALDQMQPQVKDILSQLQPQVVIFDFAQGWIPELASNMGIKTVHFSIFTAICNAFFTVPPRMAHLDEPPSVEQLKTPPPGFPKTSITSLKTFQVQDFKYLYKRFYGGLSVLERIMQLMQSCDAMALRACNEMEGPYINYLRSQIAKPYYLTGPLAPSQPSGTLDEKWAKWLDQFSEKSVIFCNFGSENYLTDEQTNELALGLELTGIPFLLVLKFGVSVDDAEAKLEAALPKGFRERVKDRGVVHVGWVQQGHILAHKNVGCFLTHAGISSIIEGMVTEAQLVALPIKGDQFMNAKLITDDLKIAVDMNTRDEDGYFGREDVVQAINTIMVNIDEEPAISIRNNRGKWREFLLNKEAEEGYIANLAKGLKDLAFGNGISD